MGFYFCSFGNRLICININRFGWLEASPGWLPVLPHPSLHVFVEPSSKFRQTGKLSSEEAQNNLYFEYTLWHSKRHDSWNVMWDAGSATRRQTASQSRAATERSADSPPAGMTQTHTRSLRHQHNKHTSVSAQSLLLLVASSLSALTRTWSRHMANLQRS